MQTINAGYVPDYVFALLCGCSYSEFIAYKYYWSHKEFKKPKDLIFPEPSVVDNISKKLYAVKDISVVLDFMDKIRGKYHEIWNEYLLLRSGMTKEKRRSLLALGYTDYQISKRQPQNICYKKLFGGE